MNLNLALKKNVLETHAKKPLPLDMTARPSYPAVTFSPGCRSSPSTENKGPLPFLGIPLSQTWQTLGPVFQGILRLLDNPSFSRRVPPKYQSCLRPTVGPSLTPGHKCRRTGCQTASEEGVPRSDPNPSSSHSAGRAEGTQAAPGHGPLRLRPLRGRRSAPTVTPSPESRLERQYFSRFPATSCKFGRRSCLQPPPRSGPRLGRSAASWSAGPHCSVLARAPRRGSRVRPSVARLPMPTAMPRPHGPARPPRPGPAVTAACPKG